MTQYLHIRIWKITKQTVLFSQLVLLVLITPHLVITPHPMCYKSDLQINFDKPCDPRMSFFGQDHNSAIVTHIFHMI